ncbi:hypothetical protein JK206_10115 [Gluconobacter cerinus]|nr:hypothetical protein [Gluconobacter cerinus]
MNRQIQMNWVMLISRLRKTEILRWSGSEIFAETTVISTPRH